MIRHLIRLSLALAGVLAAGTATAHPHVWVTMKSELIYAPDGSITGIRDDWTFDDMFSAFAIQGLELQQSGELTRDQLKPLAEDNVTSLKDFGYFTFAKANGKKVEFKEPVDYYVDYNAKESVLTLHFTLPFSTPVKVKEFDLDVYDPEYFVELSFAEKDPVTLAGAPTTCRLSVVRPQELNVPAGQQVGEAFFNQLTAAENWGAQFANKISVKCP
jgi:ABC-type uncharacterized transport system substrate-binding protein